MNPLFPFIQSDTTELSPEQEDAMMHELRLAYETEESAIESESLKRVADKIRIRLREPDSDQP